MVQAGNLETKRSDGMYRKGQKLLMYGGQQIPYNVEVPRYGEWKQELLNNKWSHIDE